MNLWKPIGRSRPLRGLAVWSLIALQSQLLWSGEFHRHEGAPVRAESLAILRRASPLPDDLAPKPVCIACQISLQNVATPAAGPALEAPESPGICPPVCLAQRLPLQLPAVVPARAPPST